jgi:hypothetical protein
MQGLYNQSREWCQIIVVSKDHTEVSLLLQCDASRCCTSRTQAPHVTMVYVLCRDFDWINTGVASKNRMNDEAQNSISKAEARVAKLAITH